MVAKIEKKQILVILPDEELSESVLVILEDEGYKVTTALSLIKALDMVKESHPDMMIIAAHLIATDGIDVFEEIKKICADPPVIMVARGRTAEHKERLGHLLILNTQFLWESCFKPSGKYKR